MKNLTWQNPEPLGFAACHKQELFVAQVLINKVKSKYCGIKDEKFYMEDLPIHPSQRKIGEGEGYVDYEIIMRPTSDFIGYVLSRGAWLKVIYPESVVNKVKENIDLMKELYIK